MPRAWHTLHPNGALSALESDAERELWAAEASRGLGHFGPNALPEAEQRSSLLAECSLGVGCAGICRRIAYIPLELTAATRGGCMRLRDVLARPPLQALQDPAGIGPGASIVDRERRTRWPRRNLARRSEGMLQLVAAVATVATSRLSASRLRRGSFCCHVEPYAGCLV